MTNIPWFDKPNNDRLKKHKISCDHYQPNRLLCECAEELIAEKERQCRAEIEATKSDREKQHEKLRERHDRDCVDIAAAVKAVEI